jgi:hypothetical protein
VADFNELPQLNVAVNQKLTEVISRSRVEPRCTAALIRKISIIISQEEYTYPVKTSALIRHHIGRTYRIVTDSDIKETATIAATSKS